MRYDIVPIERAGGGLRRSARAAVRRARRATSPRRTSSRATRGIMLMAISNKFGADGGDDRQQVRDVGRLRHALRRHERRLQSDQGPLQDGGLRASPAGATRIGRRAALGPTGVVIPENIITRPPTAELRENQKDQDSLPPYDGARRHPRVPGRRRDAGRRDRRARPRPGDGASKVERLLYLAEYKRRQAAPGVKITAPQFRPRPALSHHQPVPRPDLSMRHPPAGDGFTRSGC